MKILRNQIRGFTLVEIMIVVAIIGLLAAIALPNFVHARQEAQRNACIENLTKLEAIKQIWGVENGKLNGTLPTDADLFGPTLYMREKPKCPANGTYDLKPIGVNPTCTIDLHLLF